MSKCTDSAMCSEILQNYIDWNCGAPDEIVERIYLSKVICLLGRLFNVIPIGSQFEGHFRNITTDTDVMICLQNIPLKQATPPPFQMIATEKPGYVRLSFKSELVDPILASFKVLDVRKSEIKQLCEKENADYILPSESFRIWMKDTILRLTRMIIDDKTGLDGMNIDSNGPSVAMNVDKATNEITMGIRFEKWPEQADEWHKRPRKYDWPDEDTVDKIKCDGVFVVPVGHKHFPETTWRISFSLIEQRLVWNFNDTQRRCYLFLVNYLKDKLKEIAEDDISSYHIKTLMFWSIEETAASEWKEDNLAKCVSNCIERLKKWVENKRCPNYFIPANNMFETKFAGIDNKRSQLLNYLDILLKEYQHFLRIVVPDMSEVVRTIPAQFFEPKGERLCRVRFSYEKEEDTLKPMFMALGMCQKLCCMQDPHELKSSLKLIEIVHTILLVDSQILNELLRKLKELPAGTISSISVITQMGSSLLNWIAPQLAVFNKDTLEVLSNIAKISIFFKKPIFQIFLDLLEVPQNILQRHVGKFRSVASSAYGFLLSSNSSEDLPSSVDEIQRYLEQGQEMDIASGRLKLAAFYYTSKQYHKALSCTKYVIDDFSKHVIYVSQHPPMFLMQEDAETKDGWFALALDVSFNKKYHILNDPKGINVLNLIASPTDVVDIPPMIFAHLLKFFCYCSLTQFDMMFQALSALICAQTDGYHTRSNSNLRNVVYAETVGTLVAHCNKLYEEYTVIP